MSMETVDGPIWSAIPGEMIRDQNLLINTVIEQHAHFKVAPFDVQRYSQASLGMW